MSTQLRQLTMSKFSISLLVVGGGWYSVNYLNKVVDISEYKYGFAYFSIRFSSIRFCFVYFEVFLLGE